MRYPAFRFSVALLIAAATLHAQGPPPAKPKPSPRGTIYAPTTNVPPAPLNDWQKEYFRNRYCEEGVSCIRPPG